MFHRVHQAVPDMVLQDQLSGAVYGGFDGGKLDQYLAAVHAVFHHLPHLFQMADGTRQPVQHRLGVLVGVGMAKPVPVAVGNDRPVLQNVRV